MKFALGLVAAAVLTAASNPVPPSPELLAIHNVYLFSMRGGFDQYLANEITRQGVLRVVTDPLHADAVLTDRLGEAFETKLDEMVPAAKPPAPAAPAVEPPAAPVSAGDAAATTATAKADASKTDALKKRSRMTNTMEMVDAAAATRPPVSSMALGRGNVFLVARQSRAVLWSDFHEPRSHQPKDLKKAADHVAVDLRHALQPAPAQQ